MLKILSLLKKNNQYAKKPQPTRDNNYYDLLQLIEYILIFSNLNDLINYM